MDPDGDHQAIGKPNGMPDHVEMAVGHWVKRARVKRDSRHGGGLTRLFEARKTGVF
jgi:hypothetical protein